MGLAADLRFAARVLLKDRAFSAIAVIALALGIAATNTAFTIVNAMVLRGLPVDRPDRIVTITTVAAGPGVSYRDVEDWRDSKTLAGIAAFTSTGMTVADEGLAPEVFSGSYVSANSFGLLQQPPLIGRDFTPEDDRPGAPSVVILGHAVWTSRYGADPRIAGRTIRVNNVPSTVIGVMSEGFGFPLVDRIWQPLAMMPNLDREKRDARALRSFGRLADRASLADAQAELAARASRLAAEFPATNKDFRVRVEPYTGTPNHPIFLALAGAVLFVLLIACANVANLLLARAAARGREIAIRASLGASRSRIVRQLLVESSLIAALGGALGFALSVAGVRAYAYAVSGINFAYWYRDRWTMDGRVFTLFLAVCATTVILFGLVPALHAAKGDTHDLLKDSARSAGGRRANRWTFALLTVELAFTLVLLTGAALMLNSFRTIYRADRIVDGSQLLVTSIRLPNQKYGTPDARSAFYRRLEERLAGVNAIRSAAIASGVPFIGAPLRSVTVEGRPAPTGGARRTASYVAIGSRYFETLDVLLQRGRTFVDADGRPGHEHAIVNQRFVSIFLPNEDPIGKRIRLSPLTRGAAASSEGPWLTIAGVSPTIRQQFLSEIDPVVYVPHRADSAPAAWLMVRAPSSDPLDLMPLLREQVRALDPDLPLSNPATLETLMAQSRWGHRVFGMMFGVFAAIALLLAAVGLYAMTAYSVTQRTHEIGIRMALGAPAPQVVWLFVRRAMVPLAIGLAIGMAGAFGVGRLLASLLVGTRPADPVMLGGVSVLLVAIALVACLFPARKATRLDPVTALREQ